MFKAATSATIDTFNPFISIYLTPTGINRMVYENLVQYSSKDSSPTAGLATKWETSSDGKTWTFHLRPGMKWSDDQPITSADPQWTYTQMMTKPDMGTANGSLVGNFAKVDAPDPETLVITMKEPQASNPGLEIPVVPKHVWEKVVRPGEVRQRHRRRRLRAVRPGEVHAQPVGGPQGQPELLEGQAASWPASPTWSTRTLTPRCRP